LVAIDVDQVASRVAALPWVEHATVTRAWPNTVQISVVERKPVAQAPSAAGGFVLVDESGQVLARRAEAEPGLVTLELPPVAVGPGGNLGRPPVDALDLAGRLPKDLAAKLSGIRGSGSGLEASVTSGGTVKFCGTGDLADKLLAVNTLLNRVDPATIGVLDVCVPSAPVLTPSGGGA
jgi:cell division protein FtsQ